MNEMTKIVQTSDELRGDFIDTMRNVANSVTVVTTNGKGGRHGATVSSFCSVSADPPTILICLKNDSRICMAVEENQKFCVNVLPEGSEGIAERFAGRNDENINDRFNEIVCDDDENGIPLLEEASCFSCIIDNMVVSGSHRIFIGLVEALSCGDKRPLIYMDRKFRSLEKMSDKK